jgi:hypothetical protein
MSKVEMEVVPCGFLEIVDGHSKPDKKGDRGYTKKRVGARARRRHWRTNEKTAISTSTRREQRSRAFPGP